VSKQIQDPAATTSHTPVSTPLYGAPEVLGLDSNSETSEYTNSVDIWSLGCVIYELLVGERLFVSEFQISCYFFGKCPFPEDRLRSLSPPTDDVGISLVKSMLVMPPEDRPTAVGALNHAWLEGFMGGSEDSRGDRDKTANNWEESTRDRKSENRFAAYVRPKKIRSERNPIIQDDTRCTLGGVALGTNAGSHGGSSPTIPKPGINPPMIAPWDLASIENSPVQTEHQTPEMMPHGFPASHSWGPKAINYTILTPGEALILVVMLVGALMVAGTWPKILLLAGIPIGILVLFKILARVLTLAKALTWGESKSQTGCKNRSGEGNVTSDGSRGYIGTGEVDRAS